MTSDENWSNFGKSAKWDRGPYYCKGAKRAKNRKKQQILPSPELVGELECGSNIRIVFSNL